MSRFLAMSSRPLLTCFSTRRAPRVGGFLGGAPLSQELADSFCWHDSSCIRIAHPFINCGEGFFVFFLV